MAKPASNLPSDANAPAPVAPVQPEGDDTRWQGDAFRLAFEHAAIGMALESLSGRLVQVNRTFCQLLGRREDQLLRGDWQTLTHPADQEADLSLQRQLLAGELQFYHVEKRLLHSHGHVVWVLESVSVLRDPAGNPLSLLRQIQDVTDRRRVRETILESEVMFRGLLESAGDAILIINAAGEITLVNAQTEAMFGYRREDLVGQRADIVLPHEFQGLLVPRRLGEASEPKKGMLGVAAELAGRRRDGSEFPVELSFSPRFTEDGEFGIAIIRDISERRRADRELHKRAQQEAAIAAFGRRAVARAELPPLMDDAVTLVAQTLGVSFAAVSELSGDGAALLFKVLSFGADTLLEDRRRVDKSAVDHIGSFAGHAIRTGQPVAVGKIDEETRFDVSLLRAFNVASAVAVPLRLEDRPYGVLAAYGVAPREFSPEDIHFLEAIAYVLSVTIDRKLAEESVRRDRDFAESLVQTAQVVVLVLDADGNIVRINPYTAELTGYPIDEIKGTGWATALLPDRNRPLGREMFAAAASGKRVCSMTYAIVAKDGVEHEINWSGRALTDANGAVVGVLFIGHDMTELRSAEKRLLETERLAAIGQMAAGLAHESRNALQQIGACAEMLALELEKFPEALDLVVGVQEAEARLQRLFDDMRAYAIPLRLDRRMVSMASVWRKAWSDLAAVRAGRDVQLREVFETDDLQCAVAFSRMEQAFFNILENALDACADPVVITFRGWDTLLDDRPALAVSIRDNGPGLTPAQRAKVLEPFYTTKTNGTGLGMSIVERIVQAHGGRLEVPDSSPGAEFLLTLPRHEEARHG